MRAFVVGRGPLLDPLIMVSTLMKHCDAFRGKGSSSRATDYIYVLGHEHQQSAHQQYPGVDRRRQIRDLGRCPTAYEKSTFLENGRGRSRSLPKLEHPGISNTP